MSFTNVQEPTPMDVDEEVDVKAAVSAVEKKTEGNEFYNIKLYKNAIGCYTEAIDMSPENPSYYSNRSAAYMMLGNYNKALEDSRTNIKLLQPTLAKGHLRHGKCHTALGNFEAALLSLQKAKDLDPNAGAIRTKVQMAHALIDYEKKAEKCIKKRDFRQAAFNIGKIVSVAVACTPYKIKKAECLALLGEYEDANRIVKDVLQQDKNNVDAVYVRALCFYYDDNIEKAVKSFQYALRLSPDFKKARLALKKAQSLAAKKNEGNEAYETGKLSLAFRLYGEALNIDENNRKTNAKLRYNRALVGHKLNKIDAAIEDCNVAIKLDDNYLKAYLKRAQLYTENEDFEEALSDFKKVFQMKKTREHKRMVDEAEEKLKLSEHQDYYKILGVDKKSNYTEVKKAYRKLVLLHHPDKHTDKSEEVKKEEEKKFKKIVEAYEVLSDSPKRAQYDRR